MGLGNAQDPQCQNIPSKYLRRKIEHIQDSLLGIPAQHRIAQLNLTHNIKDLICLYIRKGKRDQEKLNKERWKNLLSMYTY